MALAGRPAHQVRVGKPDASLSAEIRRANANRAYLDSRLDEFAREYPRKWVAVSSKELVAVTDTLDELVRVLLEREIAPGELAIEYMEPEDGAYYIL